jgi:hypothetical protein
MFKLISVSEIIFFIDFEIEHDGMQHIRITLIVLNCS